MTFAPIGLTPLIGVFGMPAALHFYCDMLGFELVAASPEVATNECRFPHWVLLRLGGAELMLNTQFDSNERPHWGDAARAAAHRDTVFYIGCADVDAAYDALTRRGLQAAARARTAYGRREFGTKDPDGYAIVFQQILPHAGSAD